VQARLAQAAQAQLDALGARAEASLASLGETLRQQAATLADGVARAHARQQAEADARDGARQVAWTQALQEHAASLQQQLAVQTRDTLAQVDRLTQTAAEAPRAAAELIAQLRDQLSDSLQRDQALLHERSRLSAALTALIDDAQRASAAQQGAVQDLVSSADGLLQRSADHLGRQLQAAAQQQAEVAARLNGSAVEVASLGEAFGAAVQQFGANSHALAAQLARIETALDQSALRHDEQLAYYVAQAREVIDLSLSAQQPLVEALQRIAAPAAAQAA
jgi:hypothetical protein